MITIFCGLSLFGLSVIPFLPVCYSPSEKSNSIEIAFSGYVHDPVFFEREIISKIEGALLTKDFVGSTESVTGKSGSILKIGLKTGADKGTALFHARQVLRNVKRNSGGLEYRSEARLPEAYGIAASPALTYVLMNGGIERTNYLANYIRSEILSLKGIKDVVLTGLPSKEISIKLDYDLFVLYDMSSTQLAERIKRHLTGDVIGPGGLSPSSFKEIQLLPLTNFAGRIITLGDITEAAGVTKNYTPSRYRYRGRNAIRIEVIAAEGSNHLILSRQVTRKMKEIIQGGSSGPEIIIIDDNTWKIEEEILLQAARMGLTMIVFILFILLFYRDIKFLITVFSGLAATLLISFLFLRASGLGLHVYSLSGLAIAFTLILDNALMMTDYLHMKGKRGIILPMVAASLSTMAALSLILIVPEVRSVVHPDVALVIIINLAVSFFVSLFFVPAVYEKLAGGRFHVYRSGLGPGREKPAFFV
jgi:multidrug efflux pump subunit AcrB